MPNGLDSDPRQQSRPEPVNPPPREDAGVNAGRDTGSDTGRDAVTDPAADNGADPGAVPAVPSREPGLARPAPRPPVPPPVSPSGQPQVSYTSLDSQTMAAARAAADAAGITLEEWLSRTILENAQRSGILQGRAATLTEPGAERPTGAITRHLRSAQAAADAAGMSVSEWLSRTILENTRRPQTAMPPAEPRPEADDPATTEAAGDVGDPAPSAPATPDAAPGDSIAANPDATPAAAPAATPAGNAGEQVEHRFARVVATWRQQMDEAEGTLSLPSQESRLGARRGTLMLTNDLPDEVNRRQVPWLAGTGVIVFGLAAAMIWSLPHLPRPSGDDADPGRAKAASAAIQGPTGANSGSTGSPSSDPATATPAQMPKPAEDFVDWYKKAADAGNAHAQYVLATLYLMGKGVTAEPQTAAKWFNRAARIGKLADAQYALGKLYSLGRGVEKNDVEAVLLYQQAASQGHVLAITEVGLAFLHGRGVTKDVSRARRFLERAAEAGEINAQYTLGRIYERGIGVPKDEVIALKWFILAAEQRHVLAAQKVESLSIGLKQPQLQRAAELAREHNRRFPRKTK